MKVRYSNNINAFGGVNFVLQEFDKLKIGNILYDNLPSLSPKSSYSWRDIFYSFSSIYFCGGNCMEDAKTILANQFGSNPIFNLCSPDTLLRRMGDLCTDQLLCNTKRGNVEHQYNINQTMTDMNIKLLKKLGEFNKDEVVLTETEIVTLRPFNWIPWKECSNI
ncbi:MAG: hypothetical protein IPG79_09725 [Saprospiraceae bacterium]|nr:hypothetical protein [Saprospiraceae bacterium]